MAMVDSQRIILATKIIVLLTNENTRVHKGLFNDRYRRKEVKTQKITSIKYEYCPRVSRIISVMI